LPVHRALHACTALPIHPACTQYSTCTSCTTCTPL